MSQKKLRFSFKTERACTTYRALLRQLRAQPLHDSDRARILFQPGLKLIMSRSFCHYEI